MVKLQFHSDVERLHDYSNNSYWGVCRYCDEPGRWQCKRCWACLCRSHLHERNCQVNATATGFVQLGDVLTGMYAIEQCPARKVLPRRYVDKQFYDEVIKKLLRCVVGMAEELVRRSPFEFEAWVCRALGAEGKAPVLVGHGYGVSSMLEAAGVFAKGDGGIDGVLEIFPPRMGKKVNQNYAVIQVKGGKFTPEAVRALRGTVAIVGATAGVMVCFNRQMRMVDNHRGAETFSDNAGRTYPVIQGLGVEKLLLGERPDLPRTRSG